jgi:hypothetical protein
VKINDDDDDDDDDSLRERRTFHTYEVEILIITLTRTIRLFPIESDVLIFVMPHLNWNLKIIQLSLDLKREQGRSQRRFIIKRLEM